MSAYCVHCGKSRAVGLYCNWCGESQGGGSDVTEEKRGPSATFLVIIILLIGGAIIYFISSGSSRAHAEKAIDSAIDACGTRNRFVMAEKIVAAENAIRDLPARDQQMYSVKLHNRLKFLFCE